MKAAKWVYEINRSPNESLRFGLQQPAQKAAVVFSFLPLPVEPRGISSCGRRQFERQTSLLRLLHCVRKH